MKKEELEAYALGAIGAAEGALESYMVPTTQNAFAKLTVPQNALYGWVGLGLGIAAYDYLAIRDGKETLSHAFHRGMESPGWKFMCIGAIGATALHLSKTMPRSMDVYYAFGRKDFK